VSHCVLIQLCYMMPNEILTTQKSYTKAKYVSVSSYIVIIAS